MRDYFLDFVSNQNEKNQKRLKNEGAKGAEDPFAPFAPFVDSEYPEIFAHTRSEAFQTSNVPGNEIFEERIAIMVYDGGLSEDDAMGYLVARPCYSDEEPG